MSTIIDALVATLELDTTNYKRAEKDVDKINADAVAKRDRVNKKNDREEKERARLEKQNALDRKKRTDEVTGSVMNLGRSLAATFLGFETIGGAIKYLGELNAGQAQLGRTATKIGISADALNIYGKAVEFAGGKAEDATATFAKLSQEFTAKKLTGDIGPLLQLLQQKGVNYEDAKENLLDMGTILDNLSKKTRNMSDQDRANMFAAAGIQSGVINRMLETQAQQDVEIAKARELNAATNMSTKHAEELSSAWEGVGQAVDYVGTRLLDAISTPTKGILDTIADFIGGAAISGQTTRDVFGGATVEDRAATARLKYVGKLPAAPPEARPGLAALLAPKAGGTAALLAPKAGSLAARNNNPGNLEDRNGKFRVFATLAEGQAAMRADLEAKMGKGFETINSIITRYEGRDGKKDPYALAAYITRASTLTGKGANDKLTAADIPALMNAMTVVESSLPDSAMRSAQSGATPMITGRATNVPATAPAAGNTTTVTVGKIEVNSSAADPNAVANATGDALQRKISVAQADNGQS